MSFITKKNTNCIGTSYDGQYIILYTNRCYGIFSTNDLSIYTYIPNSGSITNPTDAFIDPHNYLIVTTCPKTLFTSWECYEISSKTCLWYKEEYTLYTFLFGIVKTNILKHHLYVFKIKISMELI